MELNGKKHGYYLMADCYCAECYANSFREARAIFAASWSGKYQIRRAYDDVTINVRLA